MTEYQEIVNADGSNGYGQSRELHEFGMAKGHPPMADKLLMVDFDKTIVPWGPLMEPKDPLPGAVDAIKALVARGYRIGIFTSRLSQSWLLSAFGMVEFKHEEQEAYVRETLDRAGIPYEFVTAEKLPAEAYIDDKAIFFNGDWQDALRGVDDMERRQKEEMERRAAAS